MLSDLNEHELVRLCELRARFRAGAWPLPVAATFASRHLISLHHSFACDDPSTITFECVLTRQNQSGAESHFVTYLTVPSRSSVEPSVDLVVREYGRRFIARAIDRQATTAAVRELGPATGTIGDDRRFIDFLGEAAFTDLIRDLNREMAER